MLDSCGLSPQQGVPVPSASSPVRPQAASSAAGVLSLYGDDPRYQPGRGSLEAVCGKKKWSHYISTQTWCHTIFTLCHYDSVHDRDPRYQPGRGLLEAVSGKKKMVALHLNSNMVPHYFFPVQI